MRPWWFIGLFVPIGIYDRLFIDGPGSFVGPCEGCMYMCMYIYMYIWICIYMYIYVYIYHFFWLVPV